MPLTSTYVVVLTGAPYASIFEETLLLTTSFCDDDATAIPLSLPKESLLAESVDKVFESCMTSYRNCLQKQYSNYNYRERELSSKSWR